MPLIDISSRVHDYSVLECASLGEAVARGGAAGKTFALVDDFFADSEAIESLDPLNVKCVEANEHAKSFERLGDIYAWLLERGFRRDCTLLVVGGGVLQDIGCFVASTLMRGIRWLFVPTTLLAQCDSCIGSKSSINFGAFKNQLGTFYPPTEVLLVSRLLESLPLDEIRSGMGEVIKLHLIAGNDKWKWLQELLSSHRVEQIPLGDVVRSSLEIKKPFVEEDEFDTGRRNILNYGHTFGHAYESICDFAIPHGIAVSIGVLTATYVSARLGLVQEKHFHELRGALDPFVTPYEKMVSAVAIEDVIQRMRRDKKASGDAIKCILTRGPGAMEKFSMDSEADLRRFLGDFLPALA
jgi:3-dehydroquinate synthase